MKRTMRCPHKDKVSDCPNCMRILNSNSLSLEQRIEAIVTNIWNVAVSSANKRDEEYLAYKDATIADRTTLLTSMLSAPTTERGEVGEKS